MNDEEPFFLHGAFEMDAATDQGDDGMKGAGENRHTRGTIKLKVKKILAFSGTLGTVKVRGHVRMLARSVLVESPQEATGLEWWECGL
ncbi:hypothetical protein E2C01_040074 [Portunus trituberculatus]|uniref:Uncharacterized protein n=1 Tax=Portunus trituberculatus TaxID=210409 RepID=A0A5B7FLP1_PORTR|nr:hypothetical protein [Portunus trituberculatus]